jgi:hypothetical protein
LRPLTDNPVTMGADDAFEFLPLVEALHESVAAASPLPLTVGVFGSWGAGKSSFLGLWRSLFAEGGPDRTIWFNPWKYDRKVEVWAALLHSVLAEMEQQEGLRERARRLARAATWLSLRAGLGHAASLATGGVVGGDQVNRLLDDFSATDSEEYRQINRFEHDFAAAVREFVGEDGRLVVFVDDLDRCTPDAALTVLESLKLFLGESRCVFVLALDVDVLAAAAANKFAGALSGAPGEAASGMAYLDKIVQFPFFLPEVDFETLRTAYAPHAPLSGADSAAFWDLLQIELGTNPRRVKRFLNMLNLTMLIYRRSIGAAEDDELRVDTLLFTELLLIRSRHRDFYHALSREPDYWRLLEGFAAVAMRRPAQRDTLVSQLPPPLRRFTQDEQLLRLLEAGLGMYDHPRAPEGPLVRAMVSTVQRSLGPTTPPTPPVPSSLSRSSSPSPFDIV